MGVISCQSQLGKRGYALIIHIYIYIYLYQASNSHHEDDSNFLVENPELNLDLLMTFSGGV